MPLPQFRCSCPDFTKKAPKNPNSPYLNEEIDRNWSLSQAGAKGWCKHIWASALAEGLLDQVELPNDPRIPEVTATARRQYGSRLQGDARRGDYFGV